ncbi:MAG: nuclear pore complex subunit [Marinilabiliales bacterium]|nr:MAG: nuclear pore complex subunit [Marinilabiliales bacterium]
MIEYLFIKKQDDSPEIILDRKNGLIKIEGKSIPENASKLYEPVFEWLSEYVKSPQNTEVQINLEYFNTSTARRLLEIFRQLEPLSKLKDVKIVWFYHAEDELIHSKGKDMQTIVQIPIELKEFS